jgi:hypothetical protein
VNHRRAGDYRAFDAALALDEDAAIASASWGIGGIAGYHATSIGFRSTDTMVAEMISAEDAQLRAVTRRIAVTGADDSLRNHDWQLFARLFKGRAARHGDFADRLDSAYRRATRVLPDLTVRAVQAALLYAGFDPGPIDGILGPRTLAALSDYHLLPCSIRGVFVGAGTLLQQAVNWPPAGTGAPPRRLVQRQAEGTFYSVGRLAGTRAADAGDSQTLESRTLLDS